MGHLVLAIALGLTAGVLAGLFGVGGGILFVPTLAIGLGLTQVHAEASSLLATLPAVVAGTWQQRRFGNVRWRSALVVGLAAIPSVVLGTRLALALDEQLLRRLFALFMFLVAGNIAWRARRR